MGTTITFQCRCADREGKARPVPVSGGFLSARMPCAAVARGAVGRPVACPARGPRAQVKTPGTSANDLPVVTEPPLGRVRLRTDCSCVRALPWPQDT